MSRYRFRDRIQPWIGRLLLCLFLLSGCSGEEPVAEPEKVIEPRGVIVAVGDSLTAGLGVEVAESYPALLEERLHREDKPYRVVNSGVSGETTSGTLSRLDWILTMDPDIIILEIGANDGLRGIDPATPRQNLKEILFRLNQEGIVVLFAGMKMVWNLGSEYTEEFNSIYPELAAQYDLVFMDFFLKDVATIPELNQRDGLHPNGDGYSVVVENIYPYVLQAIERHELNREVK